MAEVTFDFVAIGDVMLDVFADGAPRGSRVHADVRVRAGGSAVNAARAAVETGARAAVVGRVGDDVAGQAIAAELERVGIEPLLAIDDDEPTGAVVYGDGIVASRGANANLTADDVPDPLEARVVLVSGYVLFHPGSRPGAEAALARATGLRAVDLASPALAREVDADVLIGDERTIGALGGLTSLARNGRVVCETRGRAGAFAARGEEVTTAAPDVVRPGNPVGAGDAFAARFLLALADGASLADALEAACRPPLRE